MTIIHLLIQIKHFSAKINKFSTAVLQPLVINLSGLFSLCFLTIPCNFPAVELKGVISFPFVALHVFAMPFLYPVVNFHLKLFTMVVR